MRENPYLIRMELAEDCLKYLVNETTGIFYRQFKDPVGPKQKNELDCMQFANAEAKPVDYHEHTWGTETFMVSQGKFVAYCMGKGFYLEPGDLLHIQPWMGHSFTPVEPESRLNIMFQSIDQQHSITEVRQRLNAKFPGVFTSEEFTAPFKAATGATTPRTVPAPNDTPPEEVFALRKYGKGICVHEFDGIRLLLKIAKYETMDVKEVWMLEMKPGFYCEFDNFHLQDHLYWVTKGKVRFIVKTGADEWLEFDAVQDNIVEIPPYTPFKFEVVEDTEMYDLDCGARLQDLCEEAEAYMAGNPDCCCKDAIKAKFREYDFYATDVGYKK